MEYFKTTVINGKTIVLSGVGKLFYEDGFPIHLSVDILKEKGISVSILHIADELYKNGWKKRAIINTLVQDFPDCEQMVLAFIDAGTSGESRKDTPPEGREWIYSENGYEAQRELIFQSLYGFSSSEAMLDKSKRDTLPFLI